MSLFAITPKMFRNISSSKSNIYKRNWSKFDRKKIILAYFSAAQKDFMKVDELNAYNSTKIYLDKMNELLNTHAPLKRTNKCKLRFNSKL